MKEFFIDIDEEGLSDTPNITHPPSGGQLHGPFMWFVVFQNYSVNGLLFVTLLKVFDIYYHGNIYLEDILKEKRKWKRPKQVPKNLRLSTFPFKDRC